MKDENLSFFQEVDPKIILGDCLEEMANMEANSIDFIVTDPPYGLKFMGKDWDHGIPGIPFWEQALRICKPGSMIAAFGGTRTHHRLMVAIEDAGWEIRDCIMWLYGSGFPKSHNKFGFEGYGTALKPAWEPIILAMKPLEGTYAQNAEKWGVAGINIDECRIPTNDKLSIGSPKMGYHGTNNPKCRNQSMKDSRWPANLILDEEAGEMLDQQSGNLKSGSGDKHTKNKTANIYKDGIKAISGLRNYDADSGGASRFFYCAKASSSERNRGLEGMPLKEARPLGISNWEGQTNGSGEIMGKSAPQANFHPTVKPIALMKYIIKLLAPPGDPVLLDPFSGSGSTLVAAKELGIRSIGIEKQEEYCEIAKARIA